MGFSDTVERKEVGCGIMSLTLFRRKMLMEFSQEKLNCDSTPKEFDVQGAGVGVLLSNL